VKPGIPPKATGFSFCGRSQPGAARHEPAATCTWLLAPDDYDGLPQRLLRWLNNLFPYLMRDGNDRCQMQL
jgi:hypothetical protein